MSQSYEPHSVEHFFIIAYGDRTEFTALEQEHETELFKVTKAVYSTELFTEVENELEPFWNKPPKILDQGAVSDGSYVLIKGIKNHKRHEVMCLNPGTNDPQIDSLFQIVSRHLYWNTLVRHETK